MDEILKDMKQNAGYYILDETENHALGFSPTAPSSFAIWNRNADGEYLNGEYKEKLSLYAIADLHFVGIDTDKALQLLTDINFDFAQPLEEFERMSQDSPPLHEIVARQLFRESSQLLLKSSQAKAVETAEYMRNYSFPYDTKNIDDKTLAKVPFNEYTFPKEILSQTALSAMQPLLDEIAEYEADFDIPTFRFEEKSPNEIVEHLSDIKSRVQNNALKSYDEPFVPSQDKSAYPVDIHNPYSNTFKTIGYSDDRAYTFSADEYKAFEKLNERTDETMAASKNPNQNGTTTNFTREQLERAKEVDLLGYLETHGYNVKRHGTAYKIVEGKHDSTVIFPDTNKWYNFNDGTGGDIIDFLTRRENLNMVDAVKELIGESFDPQRLFQKEKHASDDEKNEALRPQMPPAAENNNRAYAYLIKTRGLDRDIVDGCIKNGSIYQSKEHIKKGEKEFDVSNCIFVGKDENSEIRYGAQRSMNDSADFVFRGDVPNSDKAYGFKLEGKPEAEWLRVCEAPIDVLSVASIAKLKGESYDDEHIISLAGVSDKAIDKFLESHDNIKVINISLDNDQAGRKAGERIKDKYTQLGYTVVESYPKEKDYNLELKKEILRGNSQIVDEPDKSQNNDKSFMYLTKTKGINEDVVKEAFKSGMAYQSEKKNGVGNEIRNITSTVFVTRDQNGFCRYALDVAHNYKEDKPDFKTEYKNSEQAKSYLSTKGSNDTLLVFNNPISMLTHMTMYKNLGKENNNHYLCCLSEYTKAVSNYIETNPNIKNVEVMLDKTVSFSPFTGQQTDLRESAFNSLKKKFINQKIKVSKKHPKNIDWNKDMKALEKLDKGMRPTDKKEQKMLGGEEKEL